MFAQQRCKNLIKILTERTTKHAEFLKRLELQNTHCEDKGEFSKLLGLDVTLRVA